MKKNTTFIFSILFYASIFSQSNSSSIGVTIGPSIVSLRGNEIIKKFHEPRFSYSTGIFYKQKIKNKISLIYEFNYENKGSITKGKLNNLNNPIEIVAFDIKNKYDYINLPILFNYCFGNKENIYTNIGPFVSCLIKAKSNYNYPINNLYSNDNTKSFKKIDYGFSIGLGYKIFNFNKFSLNAELRNNLGLNNISKLKVVYDGTIMTNSTNLLFILSYPLNIKQ